MGIKWLDKSHRSPVSCKEISREQVANRLQSRCKQGFIGLDSYIINRFLLLRNHLDLYLSLDGLHGCNAI